MDKIRQAQDGASTTQTRGEDRNPYFHLCCIYFTTMSFV